MKAIIVREFGEPEVMKLEDVPTPEPNGSEMLVAYMLRAIPSFRGGH